MLIGVAVRLDEEGAKVRCPICGEENFAPWDEDGRLIWFPNEERGRWCDHCRGCYQVLGRKVQFLFEK